MTVNISFTVTISRSDNSSSITLTSVLVINSTIANSTVPNPIKSKPTIANSNGANATITRAPEATKAKLPEPTKNTTDVSIKASGAEKPGKSEEALSTWSSSALTSSVESSGRLRARLS